MKVTKESLMIPQSLGYLYEEAIQTGIFENADCIYGFGVEGIILASAISLINRKPIVTREVIDMLKVDTVPEIINLVFVTFSVDDYEEIEDEIKYIRDKGIKLDTLISVTEVPLDVQKMFRILGISCISLSDEGEDM